MAFDLELTMASGQTPTFTFEKTGHQAFSKINTGRKIWQTNGKIGHFGFSKKEISDLFRMRDDADSIYSGLAEGDPVLSDAVSRFGGLRLTRSDPWESTVCFLVSQNNHFSRISQIVRGLHGDGGILKPDELLSKNLKPLKMGYREKYLKELCRVVAENGFSFDRLNRLSVDAARDALVQLPGVGPKVADCILVYGYAKPAFPVDVWVRKAMQNWYRVKGDRAIQEFSENQWGKHRDYAQQLLFWNARCDGIV
ncbi:MAG TPA: DNA glycosylase [Candidatus Norongarragalinales archaeon]|nr:DNA glycosylase [Candidatus Norongarragalinales archaeon]